MLPGYSVGFGAAPAVLNFSGGYSIGDTSEWDGWLSDGKIDAVVCVKYTLRQAGRSGYEQHIGQSGCEFVEGEWLDSATFAAAGTYVNQPGFLGVSPGEQRFEFSRSPAGRAECTVQQAMSDDSTMTVSLEGLGWSDGCGA